MSKIFNFQIQRAPKKDWDTVKVLKKITTRERAIVLAKRASRLYNAEVRITEGNSFNGTYIREQR